MFILDVFYLMFYAAVAVLNLIACCYLLLRKGNAFSADVTSPVRLRRWAAAFLGCAVLCHLWYLPTYLPVTNEDMMLYYRIAGMLDCMTVIPLTVVVLLMMLQDRRRPLWPVAVVVAPLVVGMAWNITSNSEMVLIGLLVYFVLICIGFIIYMVRAIRQYGRWLRDNYADLEHKEVWQSFVVLGIMLLVYVVYSLDVGQPMYEYVMEFLLVVLTCYLVWRVETLSDLSLYQQQDLVEETAEPAVEVPAAEEPEAEERTTETAPSVKNIEPLLQQYCIDTQLYLQHDLNLLQLAKTIGTNRLYLSQYFSRQGITYNAYINGLRINHFMALYREALACGRHFTAQQLASESGYRSYSTFRLAFIQRTGQNVREWMADTTQSYQNQQK